ncbi:hypothetical protein FOXYSP1_16837 [Fusarium oxysporum f. sp. phaseoli]
MTSQSIPDKIQDSYDFDDHSFHTHSQHAADDPTGVPIFPAEEAAGRNFTPFNVECRDFHINILPPTHSSFSSFLQLFPLFKVGSSTPTFGSLISSEMALSITGIPRFLKGQGYSNGRASPLQQHTYGSG